MNRKKRSVNLSVWVLLFSFFVAFGGFVYLITRPSELDIALRELSSCSNVNDLEKLWKAHPNIHDTSFANPIRNRILQLSPDSLDMVKACQFLPPRPKYVNLIVVPDLSRRITDTINNPKQIESDKVILKSIYTSFENTVKYKGKTRDRLVVDLTDRDQALGQFRQIADSLLFDPSSSSNGINRVFFEKKSGIFSKYIDSLYALSKEKPLGADYFMYFNRRLENRLIKTNIFEEYRNIVVIITDGYLEAENRLYTGNSWQLSKICSDVKNGISINTSIDSAGLWIPVLPQNFSDVEVYIFEVNERKTGLNCDFDILKTQWTKWLSSMGIRNVTQPYFFERQDANTHIINKVQEILRQ